MTESFMLCDFTTNPADGFFELLNIFKHMVESRVQLAPIPWPQIRSRFKATQHISADCTHNLRSRFKALRGSLSGHPQNPRSRFKALRGSLSRPPQNPRPRFKAESGVPHRVHPPPLWAETSNLAGLRGRAALPSISPSSSPPRRLATLGTE